ncbi:12166_t:CDS:1 [Acaulospora morrowiae]|uniref:12166_t:CDS:1 n=1 Tax=Acaulospora morrowiae TaxID=94023 RepID=A0A9N8W9C5_9GLOM|nr:12166_t:CDS:1 [Acaulospora morrowiae]
MAAQLPSDCLINIFSHFDGDVRSLHSFLLVSKNWCLNVLPILWKRTFYLVSHSSFSSRRRSKLISTYLACSNVVPIPAAEKGYRKPLFDYASFLRGFDFYQVYHAIGNWYAFQTMNKRRLIKFDRFPGKDDDECCILFITKELIKHLIQKSPIIDYFALDAEHSIPPECWSISTFPDAHNSLRYIRKFICRGNANKQEVYDALSQWCKGIEFLSIYGMGDNPMGESLANLIRGQRQLHEFILWDGTQDQLPRIIRALTTHGEKLEYLEFRFCDFSKCMPLETLAMSCTKLTTLKLIHCGDLPSSLSLTFPTPIFPNLNHLDLQMTHLPSDSLEVILKCANISLKSAHIEGIRIGNRLRILDSISNYCPNIIHLKAHIKKDKLSQLINLFRSCRKLETLKIYATLPDPLYAFVQDANDDLLNSLRQIVPSTLKKFVLKTDCAFTAHCVEIFLRDCSTNLRTLEYISYGGAWQHMKVLKKYARERDLEIKKQIAGNYQTLLTRDIGHVIVEFGEKKE